ncbi:MAG: HAMP domain-containing histidine kinase, partial [Parvularculaceae bacterium]|nr:HAMP domain-containing histidine kinase [Parvularculaceae bacterium]
PAFAPVRAIRRSLSAQILMLTIVFVLIAEMIVLIPSASAYRVDWYEKRLQQAYLVGLALENPERAMIDEATLKRLFGTTGVVGVVYDTAMGKQKRFLRDYNWVRFQPIMAVELERRGPFGRIVDVAGTFVSRGESIVLVTLKPNYAGGARVEMYVSQAQLRRDLRRHVVNILGISLVISAVTGGLFYFAVDWLIVRPVRRLTRNMARFNDHPEEPQSVLPASDRDDELGDAERALTDLERRVQDLLAQRRRLAALGAGIAKISHDLRNILASAQLMSDRLAKSEDPRVRSLSPRLVQALDRAVALSRDTLSYGRMEASMLKKTRFGLAELADEAMDDAAHPRVDFNNEVPPDMTVLGDRTQLYRALFNLVRN